MNTTIKVLSTIAKIAGLAGYFADYLPASTALIVVAIASTAKDAITAIGDMLDDGQKERLVQSLALWRERAAVVRRGKGFVSSPSYLPPPFFHEVSFSP